MEFFSSSSSTPYHLSRWIERACDDGTGGRGARCPSKRASQVVV